jgi:hypothetical protein
MMMMKKRELKATRTQNNMVICLFLFSYFHIYRIVISIQKSIIHSAPYFWYDTCFTNQNFCTTWVQDMLSYFNIFPKKMKFLYIIAFFAVFALSVSSVPTKSKKNCCCSYDSKGSNPFIALFINALLLTQQAHGIRTHPGASYENTAITDTYGASSSSYQPHPVHYGYETVRRALRDPKAVEAALQKVLKEVEELDADPMIEELAYSGRELKQVAETSAPMSQTMDRTPAYSDLTGANKVEKVRELIKIAEKHPEKILEAINSQGAIVTSDGAVVTGCCAGASHTISKNHASTEYVVEAYQPCCQTAGLRVTRTLPNVITYSKYDNCACACKTWCNC